ncbi:S1 family peptidase [Catenuloplanes japonicus]|uniref:S1 family peptidase n=1 Tax=Catenuloplanes japonicus TaxID=33876 RepID=UPI000525E567|nr:serine protease [Catenuloplanes japonicus]
MTEAVQALAALARECVVQIGAEDTAFLGSGFFVTETDVITCAHVVRGRDAGTLHVMCGDGSVITVLACEREPSGDGFLGNWPAPDLARLTVASAPGRPTVWLGGDPPAAGTETLALGRSSDTPTAGVVAHTLALRVVGESGPPLLKVNADYIPLGMSGSAVLDRDRGSVCGVVKTAVAAFEPGGGWIVPATEIRRCFPAIAARNDDLHRPGTPWRDLATRRAAYTRRIFGPAGAFGRPLAVATPPPSRWLDPRVQAVTFQPRPELADLLAWARDRSPGVPVARLLTGPGGAGKTRLALEIAGQLHADGWIAGILPPDNAERLQPVADAIQEATGRGHRVFLALDYVEGYGREIGWLISRIPPDQVRILLLARSAGAWWNNFLTGGNDRALVDRAPMPIEPIAGDRTAAVASLEAALTDFRRHLGLTGDLPPLPTGLRARAQEHTDVLNLHALALVAALHEREHGGLPEDGPASPDPLRDLARHERHHLIMASSRERLDRTPELVGQVLLAPTMFAARDETQAWQALERLGGMRYRDPAPVAACLRDLYPPARHSLRWWSPLPLDRLAETLLDEVIAESSTGFLRELVGAAPVWPAAEAFVLLLRTRQWAAPERGEDLDECIDALVRADGFRLLGALFVAERRSTGTSARAEAYIAGLDPGPAGDLVRAAQRTGRHGLLEFAVVVLDRLATMADAKAREGRPALTGMPPGAVHNLATAMVRVQQAQILVVLGRPTDALTVLEPGLEVLRRIDRADAIRQAQEVDAVLLSDRRFVMVSFARTDVTRELVVALDTCAAALSEQSRHVEAAALLREAVHKVREQRDSDPEHDRHLGHYLARLGATLISSGDDEAAVIVLTEAAGLLSSVSGLPERSVILLELSHACRRLGDHEGSAAWLAEHDRTGPLTTADPEVRHKLETTRAGMEALAAWRAGRMDELRAWSREHLDKLRALDADDPATHAVDLAGALTWLGHLFQAEEQLVEAVDVLRRRPGNKGPHELRALGIAHAGYSGYLTGAGRHQEAFVAAQDAVASFDMLAVLEPATTSTPLLLADALAMLSTAAYDAGDHQAAFLTGRRLTGMPSRYADDMQASVHRPGGHERRLALMLLNDAVGLEDPALRLSRADEAIALFEESDRLAAEGLRQEDIRMELAARQFKSIVLLDQGDRRAAAGALRAQLHACRRTDDAGLRSMALGLAMNIPDDTPQEELLPLLVDMLAVRASTPDDDRYPGLTLSLIERIAALVHRWGLPAAVAPQLGAALCATAEAAGDGGAALTGEALDLLSALLLRLPDDVREPVLIRLAAAVAWQPELVRNAGPPVLALLGNTMVASGHADAAVDLLSSTLDRLLPEITSWTEDPSELAIVAANDLLDAAQLAGRTAEWDALFTRLGADGQRQVYLFRAGRSLRQARQVATEDPATAVPLTGQALGYSYLAGDVARIGQAHHDHADMLLTMQPYAPDALAHHLAGGVIDALRQGKVETGRLRLLLKAQMGGHDIGTITGLSRRVDTVPAVDFTQLIEHTAGVRTGQDVLDQVLLMVIEGDRPAFEEGARYRAQFDPVIAAIVRVRGGAPDLAASLRQLLAIYRQAGPWSGLARGFELILERADERALGAASDGADEAVIARCLNAVGGRITIPDALADAAGIGGVFSTVLRTMQNPGQRDPRLAAALAGLRQDEVWSELVPHLHRLIDGDLRPARARPPVEAAIRLILDCYASCWASPHQ